jgi:Putative adhesin
MSSQRVIHRCAHPSRLRLTLRLATIPSVMAGMFFAVIIGAAIALSARADGVKEKQSAQAIHSAPRLTSDSTGVIAARDGDHLHFVTDLGNVIIHTQNTGKIDYHVHLETDSTQKDARELLKSYHGGAVVVPDGVSWRGHSFGRRSSGRLWVTIYINVPKNYNVDVSTGGGNIESDDLNGHANFSTAGGNIVAGNVSGPAHLETGGGHISVKNVSGPLVANTGGGHITTGSIGGNADLHTSGGHIRAGSVQGVARLDTGGGNITLEHSGTELVAETAGGQIKVGEASGLVRAKTGGGGIRVVRLSGPTKLESVGGSIYLTQVDSAVKASSSTGGITAWFVTPAKEHGACELQSNDGDIVVYIPRELPVTIDAQIQMGDDHRVLFDPAFPLKVSYDDSAKGVRTVHAEGALNGGGEVLRLRTVAGNIRVALSDSGKQMQLYKQQMEQLQQQMQEQMQSQLRALEQSQESSGAQPKP